MVVYGNVNMKKLLIAVLMPIAVYAETVRLDVEVKDYDGNPLPGVTKDNVDWER